MKMVSLCLPRWREISLTGRAPDMLPLPAEGCKIKQDDEMEIILEDSSYNYYQ